jgi:hypothetical protein
VFVRQATASNLNAEVQGDAASGASKSGNPVQIGGVYNSTQPTVTTGQVVEAQSTARGAQIVATGTDTFTVDTELPPAAALADSTANPTVPAVGAFMMGYSSSGGTTWDRAKLATLYDLDSGAGTQQNLGVNLRSTASGGSTETLPAPAAAADATSTPTVTKLGVYPQSYNGSTWDMRRSVTNSTDSTGTGISAVGLLAQLDDTSPSTVTENQFANLRMSPRRVLFNGADILTVDLTATSPSSASTSAQTAVTTVGPYRTMTMYTSLTGATGGVLDIYLQITPDAGTTFVDWAHFTQLAAGGANVKKVWTFAKSAQNITGVTVGTGTSPALAAATFIGGDWGNQIRVVFVAGASTSAGASQTIKLVLST